MLECVRMWGLGCMKRIQIMGIRGRIDEGMPGGAEDGCDGEE